MAVGVLGRVGLITGCDVLGVLGRIAVRDELRGAALAAADTDPPVS